LCIIIIIKRLDFALYLSIKAVELQVGIEYSMVDPIYDVMKYLLDAAMRIK